MRLTCMLPHVLELSQEAPRLLSLAAREGLLAPQWCRPRGDSRRTQSCRIDGPADAPSCDRCTDSSMRAPAPADKDGDGHIEPKEIQKIMGGMGLDLSKEDVSKLIGNVDEDGSGTVRCLPLPASTAHGSGSAVREQCVHVQAAAASSSMCVL